MYNRNEYEFVVEAIDSASFETLVINAGYDKCRTSSEEPFGNKHVHVFEMTEDEYHDFLCELENFNISAFDVRQKCPECDRDGMVTIGPTCFKPAWDCCGGCYKEETCEDCNGSAWLEA